MNAKSFGPVKLLHIGDIGSESLSLVHTTSFGSLRSCRKQGRKLTGGGGNLESGRQNGKKVSANFWPLFKKNYLVFLLNDTLSYMFPHIQNET